MAQLTSTETHVHTVALHCPLLLYCKLDVIADDSAISGLVSHFLDAESAVTLAHRRPGVPLAAVN